MRFIRKLAVVFSVLLTSLFFIELAAQTPVEEGETLSKKADLVDEFGLIPDCDFRGRIDILLAGLSENPGAQGVIISYAGVDSSPDEQRNWVAVRASYIANHIGFRRFERSRITLLDGGFRKNATTELWMVPKGAKFPEPSGMVEPPVIPRDKTIFYGTRYLTGEDINVDLDRFVLASQKQAEQMNALTEEDDDDEVFVDPRSEEQKHEDNFQWANVGAARLLVDRPGATISIIYYADDQYYDIGMMHHFISQGGDLLAEHAPIKRNRISVTFGGYKENPQVEFWLIPKNGMRPIIKPDDRPVEQEQTEN